MASGDWLVRLGGFIMANQQMVNDWLTLEVIRIVRDEEGWYYVILSNSQIIDGVGLNLPRRPRVGEKVQWSRSRSTIRLID